MVVERGGPRRTVPAVTALVLLTVVGGFVALRAGDDDTSGVVPADPDDVYSPVAAGEPLPDGFFQVLPRDFIEPIYTPAFLPADQVTWPVDADVIGVSIGDEAKAYPVSILNSSEMVVDEIDGVPILVTWCPLCGTAMVHRRVVDGETLVFGVQGALYLNAMTWWDHDTGSVWSQPLGEALVGPRAGQTVELLPSEFTTWARWRAAHPATVALDAPAAATSFDLADLYVVVDLAGEVRGYPVSDLRIVGAVNDIVGGHPIAVVSDPDDLHGWAVFSRRTTSPGGDVLVELEVVDGELVDRATGSTFDPVLGDGLGGPLEGASLTRVPAFTSLPGGGPTKVPVFDELWPDGTVWRP